MKHFLALFTLLFPAAFVQAAFLSGQSSDLVLGGIEPAGLLSASDIAVDPVSQKVFVADAGRHRVLRFSSAASLQNGGLAEAVFGAADMYEQAPGTSATQLNSPEGLCADSGGRLWVADSGNNRVLRFDNAASRSSGVNADGVLGQPSMTTANGGPADNQMDTPTGLAVENLGGNTVRLWVVDWYNSRALYFAAAGSKAIGAGADVVLGQVDFNSMNIWRVMRKEALSALRG